MNANPDISLKSQEYSFVIPNKCIVRFKLAFQQYLNRDSETQSMFGIFLTKLENELSAVQIGLYVICKELNYEQEIPINWLSIDGTFPTAVLGYVFSKQKLIKKSAPKLNFISTVK